MSNGTLDHNTGKPVKNVIPGDDHSTIIFEDDAVINVPGQISSEIVGQVLLTVEGDNPPTLVFGYSQAEGTAVATAEIPVPQEVQMSTEEPKPEGEEEAQAEEGAEEGAEATEEPSNGDDATV